MSEQTSTPEVAAKDPWLVPPEHRPTCPLNGEPCTSWTCLVDVCAAPDEPGAEGA